MAFPSFTVTCAFAGSQTHRQRAQDILGRFIWSESPSTGVVSTNSAPDLNDAEGQPVFHLYATADSWFAKGKNPDATNGPRIPVPANRQIDVYALPGDKFQWIAA